MQVGNLRDGDASGCELGCGDVYFFDLYLPRFDRSVANHYKCEQSHDSQRDRFVQGPIEIEQRGECMAEVKYQAKAKKQEQISHPRIAHPSGGDGCAVPALLFKEPDE